MTAVRLRHMLPIDFDFALNRSSSVPILPLERSYICCRFIQNSALFPKNRARRSAVSGLMARLPLTISPMRVAGTRSFIARAFCDRFRGLRKLFAQHLTRMGADPLQVPSVRWSMNSHRSLLDISDNRRSLHRAPIADRGRIFVWRQRSESVYLYQFHGLHDRDGAPGVGRCPQSAQLRRTRLNARAQSSRTSPVTFCQLRYGFPPSPRGQKPQLSDL